MSFSVCKLHILSANMNFKANILLILPLYILKNMRKYFSAIYRQKFNLHFQPSIDLDDQECQQIIEEYEPSILRRKSHLLSASGFSHFMVFSEMHDLIDHEQVEHVTQVIKLL